MTALYRDAGAPAFWAQRLVWADAALSLVAIALAMLRDLDPMRADNPAELASGIAQLSVYIVAALVSLRWLYLANANARALGATDLMGSPGLAIAWFFIPIANLFMPYLTLRDTWRASAEPGDWQAARAPLAILLWWICWLVAGITGLIGLRLLLEFPYEAGEAAELFFLVSNAVAIPAALLWAWMIGRIQAMQAAQRSGTTHR
jgi:Domain of unknown function (DUF4328)